MLVDIEPVLNRFRNTPEPPYLEKSFQEWLKTVAIIETLPNDHKGLVKLRNNTAELLKRRSLSLQNCLLVMLMEEEGALVSRERLIKSLYNGHSGESEASALRMIHRNLRDNLGDPELLLDSSQAGVFKMHVSAVGITRVQLSGLRGFRILHHLWSKIGSHPVVSCVNLALTIDGSADLNDINNMRVEIGRVKKMFPHIKTIRGRGYAIL